MVFHGILWELPNLDMSNIAMSNGHRNSHGRLGFSHEKLGDLCATGPHDYPVLNGGRDKRSVPGVAIFPKYICIYVYMYISIHIYIYI